MQSSPYTAPQFLMVCVHFFVASNVAKYKAFNKNLLEIDPRFFESEVSNLDYKIETTEKYGEGRTPEEAIKDLYNQLII